MSGQTYKAIPHYTVEGLLLDREETPGQGKPEKIGGALSLVYALKWSRRISSDQVAPLC